MATTPAPAAPARGPQEGPAGTPGAGAPATVRIARGTHSRPAAPVRLAHLGLGNFFRAHQAWYTDLADDADAWGVAAFTRRAGGTAADLQAQQGAYTLLVRGADGDAPHVVGSLSQVHAGPDYLPGWRTTLATPDLRCIGTTVTEAGYRRAGDGGLDLGDPQVAADAAALAAHGPDADVSTAPGLLLAGLLLRARAGLPPVTVVPCDNLMHNGAAVRRVVHDLAEAVGDDAPAAVATAATFVTTMVDRITPRPTAGDVAALADVAGVQDPTCVVTEPFTEWVLAGTFAHGRPAWETAGARFVDDVEPWERRKLWMLNGSHSLLAYAAPLRGHRTVAQAMGDPVVAGWVEQWWDLAVRHLDLPAEHLARYRTQLTARYLNPRIEHLLAQIAMDGSQKVPVRTVPVVLAEVAAGRVPLAGARTLAAWVLHLRGHGAPLADATVGDLAVRAQAVPQDDAVRIVLDHLGVHDDGTRSAAVEAARQLVRGVPR